MSEQILGVIPTVHLSESAVTTAPGDIEDPQALIDAANAQLARDFADIERASEALRRAEPALQNWSSPTMPAVAKARPVWLIVGIVWISTAIITVGAAVAIATFAG
jgi:hypothetical protein